MGVQGHFGKQCVTKPNDGCAMEGFEKRLRKDHEDSEPYLATWGDIENDLREMKFKRWRQKINIGEEERHLI
jgi:hypothetical protein